MQIFGRPLNSVVLVLAFILFHSEVAACAWEEHERGGVVRREGVLNEERDFKKTW